MGNDSLGRAKPRKPSQFCVGSKAVWTQCMEYPPISLSGFGEGPLPGKKNEPVHSCSADLSAVKTTQDESVYVSHLLSGPSSQRTDEFMVQNSSIRISLNLKIDLVRTVMTSRFRLPAGRTYNVRASELARDRQHTEVVCNILLLDNTVQAFKVS
ncbi:hypothetical protein MJT46_004184, partial [Ovis ammon polii x Ovis aries]